MFGLSGAFIAWLEHPHTLVAAWAPWLLLAVDRFLDGATASRLTAVAVLTALVFTGGHPETVLMVGLLAGAVVLWSRPGRGRILQSTGAAVLGVGLTLPLLLPFVEYLAHSAAWQGTGRHPFVLPVRALVRFVAPHAAVGHPIEAAATVSVTGLLLAGLGLWLGRAERNTLFWGVLALAMLLVAYDNPLARLVALHTPIYATRVLLVLPLALGWLAARGLDGLIALPRAAWGRVAVAAILPLVVGGELLLAARGVHAHSPPDEIAMQTPMLRFLQSQKGPFRILPLHTFLPPESATLYGLDDVRGYDALAPAGWLVQRESMGRFTSLSMVTDVLEPWNLAPGGEGLDFWNVEFLLVHPQFDLSVEDWARPLGLDLEVVYDGPDGRVFRNRRALPRVRCEEGSPVRILKRTPLEWTVEVDCRKEDRLVVADPWFPGWRAFLDGREVPWALEAGDPMVCTVPAGRHVVRVLYRPLSFELGLLGAGISLLVLLLWAWWLRGGVTACGRG
ncbi:MAG TPA: hypothetical protein ENK19_12490 [Acidobacteria bacterium]|nr:hypothetical protein [Acidobacteriota bacterium]